MYLTVAGLVKISLLLQYLRIFKAGVMRWVCIVLLVFACIWGLGFAISGWFACSPVRGAYERTIGAKCFGFGLNDLDSFVASFEAHSATNMALDIAIFMIPLVLFNSPDLKLRNFIAMVGIFSLGVV